MHLYVRILNNFNKATARRKSLNKLGVKMKQPDQEYVNILVQYYCINCIIIYSNILMV